MKRVASLLLILCLLGGLVACGSPSRRARETEDPTKTGESGIEESPEESQELSSTDTVNYLNGNSLKEGIINITSQEISSAVAKDLLTLCANSGEDAKEKALVDSGFSVVLKKHYDKAIDSTEHTCAFMFAKKNVMYHGEERPAFLVVIRGTSGGEWYSNFDFASADDFDNPYTVNFKACAQDILDSVYEDYIAAETEPLVFVTGYSRGAAAANVLGAMLDDLMGQDSVFVYTFATPATVKEAANPASYKNIFNFINPGDFVTELPLKAHGFGRFGQDILLDGDMSRIQGVKSLVYIMAQTAPTVASYYQDRHSLTSSGLSEDGMTTKELMTIVCDMLTGKASGAQGLAQISQESDLYPLASALLMMNANLMLISTEHMPTRYSSLISLWSIMKDIENGEAMAAE